MSSLNALKYKITIHRSYYAGAIIFLLYSTVLVATLFVTPFTVISSIFYISLLLIALYASKKAYLQSTQLMLSESGMVERVIGDKPYYGKISRTSFYNGFVIFLILDINDSLFIGNSHKQFITIYSDAISESDYRLLARLINSGRN